MDPPRCAVIANYQSRSLPTAQPVARSVALVVGAWPTATAARHSTTMGKKKGGKKGKKGKADFLVTPEGAQMRIERERHKGGPARGRCHNAMMPAYHHSCSRFATALAPFGFSSVNDIVATPLGVQCTVHGVKEGALFLKWPGGLISPATCAPSNRLGSNTTPDPHLALYTHNNSP